MPILITGINMITCQNKKTILYYEHPGNMISFAKQQTENILSPHWKK
jgi:hypothetical protein